MSSCPTTLLEQNSIPKERKTKKSYCNELQSWISFKFGSVYMILFIFFFFLLVFCVRQLAPKVNLTRLLKAYFSNCCRGVSRFTSSPHMPKVTRNSLVQVAKDVAQTLFTTSFTKFVSINLDIEIGCFHIFLQNGELLEACQ